MCSKQCRDENGFKCHLSSESHARQMALFGDAPAAVVDEFSRQFEEAWLDHLRRAHPTSRVRADLVYNELIQQRDHVHMNATRWHTLTEFVAHLGKTGTCKVDEDERGLHVTLAAADARVSGAEEARLRRARAAAEAEARRAGALALQAERAREEERRVFGVDAAARAKGGELVRKEGDGPVRMSVGGGGGGGGARRGGSSNGSGAAAASAAAAAAPRVPIFSEAAAAAAGTTTTATTTTNSASAAAAEKRERPKSKLELLMEQEQAAKRKREEEAEQQQQQQQGAAAAAAEKRQRANGDNNKNNAHPVAAVVVPASDAPWLSRGLVVKIMAPELKESGHYKRKAVVVSIVDGAGAAGGKGKTSSPSPSPPALGFVGELETLDSDRDVLRVDQAQLETVLPSVGGVVRVVSSSATNAVNLKEEEEKKKKRLKNLSKDGEDDDDDDEEEVVKDVSRFVGREGRLSEVDTGRYRARVSFEREGKEEEGGWFEYEDICKVR